MNNATKIQVEIAKKLGLDVSTDSPLIAAAKIESAVFEAVNPGIERRKASEKQMAFLKILGIQTVTNDFIIVSALIEEELQKRNLATITRLDLKPGDKVVSIQYGQENEDIISSIASNHRIWFKGGQGRGCWPTQVIRKMAS